MNTLPRDKLLHIALGALWLAIAAVVAYIQHAFGVGPALAASTTAYAVMYEVSQWYRREGQPEVLDALATALPGWMAWAVLKMF